jgi:hypothetical protein
MKLRTLSEALGAVWIALTEAMEPHHRAKATAALAEQLDDGEPWDLEAKALVESIVEEDARDVEAAPWHHLLLLPISAHAS